MARTIVAAVFFGFCLVALLYVVDSGESTGSILLAAGLLLVLLGLQLLYFSRPDTRVRSGPGYLLLALQAALVYLPLLRYGDSWLGLPSLLAGTVLLVLPTVAAWTAFAAIVASVAAVAAGLTGLTVTTVYIALATVVFGLEVYGLTRLARLITELHAARSELASAAVAHERLRFARDLHDLLGQRLSEIAPKGELAHRLVTRDPDRARRELSEILEISRRALADVRTVARGYRELNLDEASRAAVSVLAAASVDVRMELKHGELPVRIRSLVAAVLREGATNILRHSEAEHCEVTLRQAGDTVCMDMVNDGIVDRGSPAAAGGIGTLSNLVADLGGELSARVDPDGRFRLHVTVPVSHGEEEEPDEAGAAEQVPRSATRRARALLATVLCGLYGLAILHLVSLTDDAGHIAVSVGYLTVLLGLQLGHFSRPGTRLRSPVSYALLPVQAALVFLPLLQFGVAWVALPGFLAGSVLLVLRPVAGWSLFTLIVGVIGGAQAGQGGRELDVAYNVVGAVVIGLVVYGLTWMVRSMTELRAARIELAQAAVAEERLRFARDLHDLLGLSLSAIALKSELAHRLVPADPGRARRELSEILEISRLALADVRSVASGYRELSLHQESHSAESLLLAADVDVRMELRYGELPARVGTVLATVLREGVTNVLRHSKGEHCEITVREDPGLVLLAIVNDGVPQVPDLAEPSRTGSGLRNLAARVGMVGGELTSGIDSDGRFRLQATVPL